MANVQAFAVSAAQLDNEGMLEYMAWQVRRRGFSVQVDKTGHDEITWEGVRGFQHNQSSWRMINATGV